jgi:segregation and condensation protein A
MPSQSDPPELPFDPDAWAAPSGEAAPRDAEMLRVAVDGVEGPLDLLLSLARTQKVDLARISVVALADQYLSFIREAARLRLELAADYLVMAAWLTFLKSRMILPRPKTEADTLNGEDLAARLQFRLMRLDAMRNAAAQLMTRKRLGQDVFPRGMPESIKSIRERHYTAEIYDLLKAYSEQRSRRVVRRAHVVKRRQVWSIKEARSHLFRLIGATPAADWVQLDLCLEQFLPSPEVSRTALAASFGATLEMARDGVVELQQATAFAPIYLRRRSDLATSPAPADAE